MRVWSYGRFFVLLLACAAVARAGLVPPTEVPGKEYSDRTDINAAGAADAQQDIHWYGDGTVSDSFDYDAVSWNHGNEQVDAMANIGDYLFDEVIHNQCPLLLSTGSWTAAGAMVGDPNVRYETPSGARGVWATQPEINNTMVGGVPVMKDVDGLEVWGPEQSDDANLFSLEGDTGAVSVWSFDKTSGAKSAYATQAQIAAIINSVSPASITESQVDVDAMMVYDHGGLGFDPTRDSIMFSIAPVAGYDGGEIWVADAGVNGYLNHGGHLWDTTFGVKAAFGAPDENVNALEAVPEPCSALVLLLAAPWLRRRRRQA